MPKPLPIVRPAPLIVGSAGYSVRVKNSFGGKPPGKDTPMLDTAAEIHSPNAWENFLSTQPEWLKFTSEEHAAAKAVVAQTPGWGGLPLVLSALVSVTALVWLFIAWVL